MHQQVDVVVFPVELAQFGFEISAHLAHDLFAPAEHRVGEHVAPVFGDENQMHMQAISNMSSFAYICVWFPPW